jgi:hypothetical protein
MDRLSQIVERSGKIESAINYHMNPSNSYSVSEKAEIMKNLEHLSINAFFIFIFCSLFVRVLFQKRCDSNYETKAVPIRAFQIGTR